MDEKKKILIADNEALDMEFLELMLSKVGFDVEKTDDGKSALDKIKQRKPDLILINTILPKISGWEVLKSVKADAALADVQVILLSDIDNIKERAECYALGAEDYITKPFNFSVLVAKIGAVLRSKEFFLNLGRRGASL